MIVTTFADAVALLGRFVGSHRFATLVQQKLVVAHKDSMLGFALEILYALYGAIVLSRRCVQFHTNPGAGLEVCGAHETDDAAGVVGPDEH